MTLTHHAAEQRLSELARGSDDVVTWGEMLAIGISPSTIKRLIKCGWLHRIAPGVYLVGSGSITPRGRLRAAVRSTGNGSRLTCDATLYLFDVVTWMPSVIDVVVGSAVQAGEGVRTIRSTSVPAVDYVHRSGIPTVTVERALVDLSPDRSALRLLKHMRNAAFRHCFDPSALRSTIDRLRNRGTCDNVRRALNYFDLGDGGSDSGLEERFHRLVLDAGFRDPRSNIHIPGLLPNERVDFVWESDRLIVEVDGPHHLDEIVRVDDVRRDRILRANGWRVIRVWWWELDECPGAVLRRVGSGLS